jgi:hypothetical protein
MGINIDIAQNIFQTTDATPALAASYSFPANASAIVQVRVIGVDSSQNTYALEQRYGVKRALGNCAIVDLGVTVLGVADPALLLASATLNVNGSSIEIDVTGVALTTINWAARMDIMYLN